MQGIFCAAGSSGPAPPCGSTPADEPSPIRSRCDAAIASALRYDICCFLSPQRESGSASEGLSTRFSAVRHIWPLAGHAHQPGLRVYELPRAAEMETPRTRAATRSTRAARGRLNRRDLRAHWSRGLLRPPSAARCHMLRTSSRRWKRARVNRLQFQYRLKTVRIVLVATRG